MKRHFLNRWFLANGILAGIFAIGWLLLRSLPRPSRLAYPCQRAAASTALLALGAPLLSALISFRQWLAERQSTIGFSAAAFGLIATLGAWGYWSRLDASKSLLLPSVQTPVDYRAEVFHLRNCPQDPIGDRFPCFDSLVSLMGAQGLKLYEDSTVTGTSGPNGILDADDTVVIKINYQWDERGGTNTDLLQGLIRAIIDHPAGFAGEIVVCENAQFASVEGFDRPENNAQDPSLSPHDVVSHFQDLGYNISLYDWTSVRNSQVDEYSEGDLTDGYIVYPFDSQLNGAVSYPKFETAFGTLVSLRDGIWDPVGSAYDQENLKFINLPVLKSHSIYGVTANIKDYMGVVTNELGTNSHSAIRNGLLGAHLGVVGLADLNILDAIWINAHPNGGPGTGYGEATRRDELVASIDPVATDLWATQNILVPAFEDNGYADWPKADPTDPNSDFREYLDNSTYFILAAGFDVTNNPGQIDVFSAPASLFTDGFESGDTLTWSSTVD